MELQLKQETLTYLETFEETPFSFETTQEAIVPDYCADVQRIVDTTGCVLLHSKELLPDGRLEVKGTIKASVLFIPEGEKEVNVLQLSIPMHSYYDGKHLSECETFTVSAHLKSIDSRLLNPRKLLTRAETTVEICGYVRKNILLTSGIEENDGLEKLHDSGETIVVTSAFEREFSYADEMVLSASRTEMKEILSMDTDLKTADCRILGNKLVLKGLAQIHLLYKDMSGNLSTLHQEFMFSQIAESDVGEEFGLVQCLFKLVGYEYQIGSEGNREDRHTVTISLHIQGQVQILEKKKVTFLSDMYSIYHNLTVERQGLFLVDEPHTVIKKQSLRELLPTASGVKDVVYATVVCGNCTCLSGEQGSFVEAPVRIHCLYYDENDALLAGEKEISIKAETEMNSLSCPSISIQPSGDISATPATDGIDIRFILEFLIATKHLHAKTTIVKAELDESTSFREKMPSLVLRKFEKGMSLWDVAKAYHTTIGDILIANGLDHKDAVPTDQLLLIPRHK